MRHAPAQSGMTLMEIVTVVAIVMILATIAIPQLAVTAEDAKVSSAEQQLQRVRTALDYYLFQHQEALPGFDPTLKEWSESALVSQLTKPTNLKGAWGPLANPNFPFGPYLTEGIPANPFNDLTTILVREPNQGIQDLPDDSTGWLYYTLDGSFRANSTGTTPKGKNIFDL